MNPIRILLPIVLLASSCQFGLDYSGDESGLLRTEIPVQGHGDLRLSYLVAENPTKPRVIFIHGSPGSAAYYAGYLRELGDEAEVMAVDRLGYGESADSGTVVSFERQAAAIAPLLEPRGGVWPVIVGHSLGGPIATRLAADYPDRVGALIVVAGNLNSELENPRWYNDVARWRILQPFLANFLKVSNREMWACRVQVEGLETKLDRITCPIVFIHGTSDSLVPFEAIEYSIEQYRGHPNAFVLVLLGEEHGITKLRREEVLDTIRDVLEGVTDFVEEDDR